MKKDGLIFFDDGERIIFNYYSFCEVLIGCISEYCGISKQESNAIVENSRLFKSPISQVQDVYFFSHEHPFHWAMLCYHGDLYWEKNPDLINAPESYDEWEAGYILNNDLSTDLFIFAEE